MSIYEKALMALELFQSTKKVPETFDGELLEQLDRLGDEYQSEIDEAQRNLDEIEKFMEALERR